MRCSELYQTGLEPDYVIDEISSFESAGNGLIRVYVSARHGRLKKVRYSFVCAPATLNKLAARCLRIAKDAYSTMARAENREGVGAN